MEIIFQETIIQLKDITTGNPYIPIGYWSATTEGIAGIETSLFFSGCYDGKGKTFIFQELLLLHVIVVQEYLELFEVPPLKFNRFRFINRW